ncbi:hypothetical protein GGR52DRAFT_570858 [Hypoxylon sp. FL1284]|nr:hypothetical protein GGR52DRAFT_570858 [Hypoxylon sp. FL1284]
MANSSEGEGLSTGENAASGDSRPSFADYWRRTKEAARSITFVSNNREQDPGFGSDTQQRQQQQKQQQAADDSAEARKRRRAQVLGAQARHRRRKADYTRQLEMDVARLRDQIESAGRDGLALRAENEAMRRRLQQTRAPEPQLGYRRPGAGQPQLGYRRPGAGQPQPAEYTIDLLSGSEPFDTHTPLFQVRRTAGTSSSPELDFGAVVGKGSSTASAGDEASSTRDASEMTEEETDRAINFILGLEHICWNHFWPSYYTHDDYDPAAPDHGHALMASAIVVQHAPPEAWQQYTAAKEQFSSAQRKQQQQQQQHHNHHHHQGAPAPAPASTFPSAPANPTPTPNHPQVLASWPSQPSTTSSAAAGLTLSYLRDLAAALNPACDGKDGELAPVQAWFEMAARYGRRAVRDAAAVARLGAELAPAVGCPHFGAQIPRPVFEGALERVLGPAPVRV